jgi:hypothetical protein
VGSFKIFIDKINNFFSCRQQQTVRSHLAGLIFICGGQIAVEMAYPHQAHSNFIIDNIIRRLFSHRPHLQENFELVPCASRGLAEPSQHFKPKSSWSMVRKQIEACYLS